MRKPRLVGKCSIAILIGFLVLNSLLPAAAAVTVVPRLTTDDPVKIRAIKNQIMRDKGYTIVFIGDSLLYSSASQKDAETIPSQFLINLRKSVPNKNIHIYDLSLPGASAVNCYQMVKCIAPAKPDLIIMDINLGWFGNNKNSHPALNNLNAVAPDKTLKPVKVPKFPDYLYKRWSMKDFSSMDMVNTKLGAYKSDPDNVQWVAFQNAMKTIKDAGVKGIMFFPPRNKKLYYKYHLVDEMLLSKKVAEIMTLTKTNDITVFDYTWRVHEIYFSDAMHMLPNGNKWLGKSLASNVYQEVFAVKSAAQEQPKPVVKESAPSEPGVTWQSVYNTFRNAVQ